MSNKHLYGERPIRPHVNAFVTVAVAAAKGQDVTLTAKQCAFLMKDQDFADKALNSLTNEEYIEAIKGSRHEWMRPRHWRKIDPSKKRNVDVRSL